MQYGVWVSSVCRWSFWSCRQLWYSGWIQIGFWICFWFDFRSFDFLFFMGLCLYIDRCYTLLGNLTLREVIVLRILEFVCLRKFYSKLLSFSNLVIILLLLGFPQQITCCSYIFIYHFEITTILQKERKGFMTRDWANNQSHVWIWVFLNLKLGNKSRN